MRSIEPMSRSTRMAQAEYLGVAPRVRGGSEIDTSSCSPKATISARPNSLADWEQE
jgi:hypothetical protein